MQHNGGSASYIVGLTGGIGSGKSTVAELFAARGVPYIDADQLTRELVAPGSELLAEIVGTFGDGMLDRDGHLDRRRLREILQERLCQAGIDLPADEIDRFLRTESTSLEEVHLVLFDAQTTAAFREVWERLPD